MQSDCARPKLQHAETDGAGPVKKRRPPLSCIECRKRKVKCDRERPCGPCSKYKSPTCTYRPLPKERRATACENETAAYENALTSPSISSRSTVSNSGGVVSELTERLRHLEGKLAAVTKSKASINQSPDTVYYQQPSTYFVKSKFFGESHWLNCLEPYESLGRSNVSVQPDTNRTEVNAASELYATVAECKRMAHIIKATRMLHPTISTEIQESVPSKAVCDHLIQCYLRTFEGVFRVLHIPSFLSEYEAYWRNANAAKPSVLIKILLVCAIGVAFYTGPEQPRLRGSTAKWIQAAESWLSAPHQKSRLNMAGLQIYILLLLARQICSVDGDLIWISAGALLRSAMHLGLHRDPRHFQKISKFHMEMRRRLWAVVMEITVQSSLDMGEPPMISPEEYDTQPPSNINDTDLDGLDGTRVSSTPDEEFTQTSMQIACYETLPLRLEITKQLNHIRSTPSYKETLRLTKDILDHCRKHMKFFQGAMNAGVEPHPTAFHLKLFDTLIRRFALCLHRPFFNKATDHPEYYYSRKMSLDLSVIIAAPATQLAEGEEDDWTRLCYHCVGLFKSFFLHSLSTVYFELISQLEDQENVPLCQTGVNASTPTAPPLPAQLEVYRNIIVDARNKSRERLRRGETNPKGFTWLCASVARIDALANHTDPDAAVLAAAKSAVTETEDLMRAAYFAENGAHIDLSRRHGSFAGRDHSRGEGADDITATTPRVVEVEQAWGEHAGEVSFAEDMDWEDFMQDDLMGVGWGFEGNPESWFGWDGCDEVGNYPNTMF